MPISNAGENLAMIAALQGTGGAAQIRLHSGDPGASGTANLLSAGWTATGGSGGAAPTYPTTTWTIPTDGGQSTNATTVSFTRNVAGSVNVTWISIWKVGAPTFVWKAPVSSVSWAENQTITFEIGAIRLDLGNA
jgi:hypothetical protein